MLRYSSFEPNWPLAHEFSTATQATISVINTVTGESLTIAEPNCTKVGATNIYTCDLKSKLEADAIGDFTVLHYVMTNGTEKFEGLVTIGGFSDEVRKSVFLLPFEVDIMSKSLKKGETWEPDITFYANSADLKVTMVFYDTTQTLTKATANVDGGGDDQLKLILLRDSYQIHQVFLTAEETAKFAGRYLNIDIAAETPDGKVKKTTKKLEFDADSVVNI